MKRIISVLLIISMLMIGIYIPINAVTLPDGSDLSPTAAPSSYTTANGWTKITTATQFKNIATGGKYYLGADIDLTASGVNFKTLAGGANSAKALILDGCGHTVTTKKPLFEELPGGESKVGTHSQIKNLIIKGSISVTLSEITAYDNGFSVAALVGKANGGIFTNIVNNASVTVSDSNNSDIRVAGLVGSVFNDSSKFINCQNNGDLTASVGSGASNYYAMGGIVAYIGYNDVDVYKAYFASCKNTGDVTNKSTATEKTFAGGILGTKKTDTTVQIIACSNTGVLSALNKGIDVAQGLASKSFSNMTIADATKVSSASEFAKINGSGSYYISKNITLSVQNPNKFTGTVYGLGNKITSSVPAFGDVDEATVKDLTFSITGWTAVSTASEFKSIAAGGKYYLTKNIDLTASGADFETLAGGSNSAKTLSIDGCGFSVKTDKMLIKQLPGGGALGTHSEIRNLVINGNINVASTALAGYSNGNSVAALVGKANGGIFKNITNNASVTVSGASSGRIAGIIGSVFNDSITVENCVNNGNITANAGAASNVGVAGILGYVGLAVDEIMASFIDCVNNGKINNTSTDAKYSFAGGITAVKTDISPLRIIACKNNGDIHAGISYGDYFARSIYENVIVSNHGISINGSELSGFSVVADSASDANAKKIVDFVKSKYGIDLPIVSADKYTSGDAILIGQGNDYGGIREGIDCDIANDGFVKVFIDAPSANISSLVDSFLADRLTTNRKIYDFSLAFESKTFTYNWASGVMHIGYTYKSDKITNLASGVKYIERTYTTDAGVDLIAYILILEADAKAHFEVASAKYHTVSSCPYAEVCGKKHVTEKTTSELAKQVEATGKNVIAATNLNFAMKSAGCYTPWGMQIVNGTVYREPNYVNKIDSTNGTVLSQKSHLGKWWIGITKDGKMASGGVEDYHNNYKGNIQQGFGGSYFLIKNGVYQKLSGSDAGDARTAAGYNAAGDFVVVVVDGNDKNNAQYPGANYADMSQVFMDLDMDITNALMLDGGGSSNMLVEENGVLELKTHIYSNGGTDTAYGTERALADALVIIKD